MKLKMLPCPKCNNLNSRPLITIVNDSGCIACICDECFFIGPIPEDKYRFNVEQAIKTWNNFVLDHYNGKYEL